MTTQKEDHFTNGLIKERTLERHGWISSKTILTPMTSGFSKLYRREGRFGIYPLMDKDAFSCLVDADGLDTEAFMSPEKSELVEDILK
jgi:hypothetical protein